VQNRGEFILFFSSTTKDMNPSPKTAHPSKKRTKPNVRLPFCWKSCFLLYSLNNYLLYHIGQDEAGIFTLKYKILKIYLFM